MISLVEESSIRTTSQSAIPSIMKQFYNILAASLLIIISAPTASAGQPTPAMRPTNLTLVPAAPKVFQYRPETAGIVQITNRKGAFTLMPLRAFPRDERSVTALNFFEYQADLGFEKAKSVVIVNVSFDPSKGLWKVQYIDRHGDTVYTSNHPPEVAKN